jgi:hypothetical protein
VQRLIRRSAFVAGSFLLAFAVSAAAANTPTISVIRTKQEIAEMTMNGSRLVYSLDASPGTFPRSRCTNRILVRNVRTGSVKRVSGKRTCGDEHGSTGAGVRELAVAGNLFAWIVNFGGNTEFHDYLRMASLPRPRERQLAAASRYGDFDVQKGAWIGHLVGADNLLAVNRWSTDANGIVKRSELDLVSANGLHRVVLGAKAIFAQSADSGRIAALRTDGTVGIYNARGKLLVEVAPESAKEVALRGNDLLVLTKTRRLVIYGARSGALVRSWPVRAGAATLDTYAGLAVYADHPKFSGQRFKVHVLKLATGKDVVVGAGTYEGRPSRDIQLEAPGLVYAKNPSTLVFIPRAGLLTAVS